MLYKELYDIVKCLIMGDDYRPGMDQWEKDIFCKFCIIIFKIFRKNGRKWQQNKSTFHYYYVEHIKWKTLRLVLQKRRWKHRKNLNIFIQNSKNFWKRTVKLLDGVTLKIFLPHWSNTDIKWITPIMNLGRVLSNMFYFELSKKLKKLGDIVMFSGFFIHRRVTQSASWTMILQTRTQVRLQSCCRYSICPKHVVITLRRKRQGKKGYKFGKGLFLAMTCIIPPNREPWRNRWDFVFHSWKKRYDNHGMEECEDLHCATDGYLQDAQRKNENIMRYPWYTKKDIYKKWKYGCILKLCILVHMLFWITLDILYAHYCTPCDRLGLRSLLLSQSFCCSFIRWTNQYVSTVMDNAFTWPCRGTWHTHPFKSQRWTFNRLECIQTRSKAWRTNWSRPNKGSGTPTASSGSYTVPAARCRTECSRWTMRYHTEKRVFQMSSSRILETATGPRTPWGTSTAKSPRSIRHTWSVPQTEWGWRISQRLYCASTTISGVWLTMTTCETTADVNTANKNSKMRFHGYLLFTCSIVHTTVSTVQRDERGNGFAKKYRKFSLVRVYTTHISCMESRP